MSEDRQISVFRAPGLHTGSQENNCVFIYFLHFPASSLQSSTRIPHPHSGPQCLRLPKQKTRPKNRPGRGWCSTTAWHGLHHLLKDGGKAGRFVKGCANQPTNKQINKQTGPISKQFGKASTHQPVAIGRELKNSYWPASSPARCQSNKSMEKWVVLQDDLLRKEFTPVSSRPCCICDI